MKLVFFILLFTFVPEIVFSNTEKNSYGTSSIFYKGETVNGYKTKISFQFPQCLLDSQILSIEKRESETYLTDVDSLKRVPVRYVYLIGRFNKNDKCKSKTKETELNYEIDSDPRKMTHFFISVESPTKIISVKNNVK
ncbi:MAG: hypothetical protein M9962_05750 [Oligoflexia bacterium]|nr:hypothetical protein [Oligoflexia bacterium]